MGVAQVGHTGTRPKCLDTGEAGEAARNANRAATVGAEANGVLPAATDGRPALEPPGLGEVPGVARDPMDGLSPTGLQPNSLVVVLPMRMPPAAFARSTAGASTAAMFLAIAREPDA